MPNIDRRLLAYAESKGLSWLSTGGGCDFIGFCYESIGGDEWGRCVILIDEFGDSPVSDSKTVIVCIGVNDDHTENIEIAFSNAADAIDCIRRMRLNNLRFWSE